MALIKWGMIVVDGRGKLGGHVLTKTRSGATARTKVTPVNPQSTAQAAARSRLASNSQNWRNLSESQRLAWNAIALETVKTNVFGDNYFPTGKNLFTGLNSNLLLISRPTIDDPVSLPALPNVVAAGVTTDTTLETMVLSVSIEGEPVNSRLIIEATNSFSPGRFNFDGKYRFIGSADPAVLPDGPSLWAMYVNKFGSPVAGQKIGFRFYFVNQDVGNASPRFSSSSISS